MRSVSVLAKCPWYVAPVENTVADVFAHYDGAFVGTCLKRDGKLDAPVDVERVARFMAAARTARGE